MATFDLDNSPGYVIFPSYFTSDQIDSIKELVKIENLSTMMSEGNLFYTEDLKTKLIKQVQHLEMIDSIRNIGQSIIDYLSIDGQIVNMQIFIKHPEYKITKPHQDGAYFQSDKYLTFWIPLQDVNEENSCLYYLDNSHRYGLLEHNETGSVVRTRTGVKGLSLEYKNSELSQYKPAPMNKGDMICHHPYTLHYSSTNKTNDFRVALTCIVKLN